MAKRQARLAMTLHDGTDPVGSLAARRIRPEYREWLPQEASRSGRSQRAVMEDIIESFIKYRNGLGQRYPYENLPRHSGRTFRMYIRLDLLDEVCKIVNEDEIYNGDFVNAAFQYEMNKGV